MKRAQTHAWKLVFMLLIFWASTGEVIAETPRSMLDGDVLAAEANYVELVVGASGDVIQVKVKGCETCKQASYLPSGDLIISRQGLPVSEERLAGINRRPGTLVLSVDSQLIRRVDFWVSRGGKESDQ